MKKKRSFDNFKKITSECPRCQNECTSLRLARPKNYRPSEEESVEYKCRKCDKHFTMDFYIEDGIISKKICISDNRYK